MNPAYAHARFRAELPRRGLPERFGVVTAWNPDGITSAAASNEAANARLKDMLQAQHLCHFPVTGGSSDFTHAEPGFGIIAEKERIIALGCEFRQEAIFWIERGFVHLVPCTDERSQMISPWHELATSHAAHPAFHFRGPLSLLDSPATAFLCSTFCPGDAILEAYAWARQQCDGRTSVISGFQTPVEQDVLAILARRDAQIVWVAARDLPKKIPAALDKAEREGRLLILSPFPYGKPTRPTRESCSKRNQFILRLITPRYIAHAAAGSALRADLNLVDLSLSTSTLP